MVKARTCVRLGDQAPAAESPAQPAAAASAADAASPEPHAVGEAPEGDPATRIRGLRRERLARFWEWSRDPRARRALYGEAPSDGSERTAGAEASPSPSVETIASTSSPDPTALPPAAAGPSPSEETAAPAIAAAAGIAARADGLATRHRGRGRMDNNRRESRLGTEKEIAQNK